MRFVFLFFLFSILSPSVIYETMIAQDVPTPSPTPTPEPGPTPDPIRFPTIDPSPQPIVPVEPTQVTELAEDEWYIVEADVPCLVLTSRQEYVKVTKDEGPLKLRGKFAGGKGKIETRVCQGKWIYTIEAQKKGDVELLIVPVGISEESQVLRQILTVMGGGPKPPPGPGPGPNPDPEPDPEPQPDPTPIPVDGKRVLIIYESADLSKYPSSQVTQFTSGNLREYLTSNCSKGPDGRTPEFRIWDKDTDVSQAPTVWQEAMKLPRGELPTLIVSNGVSGFSGPLPNTEEETLTILRKYLEE